MFNKLIINDFPELINFLKSLNLIYRFSRSQVKYIQAFIIAMMLDGFHGKMTNVSNFSLYTHRSSVCRFLDNPKFDDTVLQKETENYAIFKIWDHAMKTRLPIYTIIDDTTGEKTPPSSKAENPIEGCGYHFSHLDQKTVYGHQFVEVMLRCGDLILPYRTVLYDKTLSKIRIAVEAIQSLPKPPSGVKAYVLADSWYTCKDIMKASASAGFGYIGAMKTNRVIYPQKEIKNGMQIKDYAQSLKNGGFDLVTVNGTEYLTHTYVGKINGYPLVKVVISWPKKTFGNLSTLKVFVSTDADLTTRQLLNHYCKRWPVEVFFRESNRYFGMKQCQARSKRAIMRYQYLLMLSFIFCELEVDGETLSFSKRREQYQKRIKISQITWIFDAATKNANLEDILHELRLA